MNSPSKEELKAKYNADIKLSVSAEKAFPYINSLIEKLQDELYQSFLNCSFRDEEELLRIKMASAGISSIIDRLTSDIDNGKIAAKQLIELEK